jgi:hypothetical protein
LFRDAAKRVVAAADALAIRGLIVHAISDQARAFYLALGFEPSPLEPMMPLVTLADLRDASLSGAHVAARGCPPPISRVIGHNGRAAHTE